MKKALITGVTGQDGSYLTEFLLSKNYDVLGIARTTRFIENIRDSLVNANFKLVYGDIIDYSFISNLILDFKPDEIYNLAGVTKIEDCWNIPHYTIEANSAAPVQIMSHILKSKCRFVQASSREIFGNKSSIMNEESSFDTTNPYGVSKLYTHLTIKNYRDVYKSHFNSAILFNHESERRGGEFLTKKVTTFVGNISKGIIDKNSKLKLGNLNATRDWGYAPDFVEAMWLMLQQDKPDDYVICTSRNISIEYLLNFAFSYKKLNWRDFVIVDQSFVRSNEIYDPKGSYKKINNVTGWKPKVTFEEMIERMINE